MTCHVGDRQGLVILTTAGWKNLAMGVHNGENPLPFDRLRAGLILPRRGRRRFLSPSQGEIERGYLPGRVISRPGGW